MRIGQSLRPVKTVRKALESLYQKQNQTVRKFALEVEDTLAEFITASAVGLDAAQRQALAVDREAQALEVFVDGLQDKLRDWAKARDFESLKDAIDFATSEEHNVKPKAQSAGPANRRSVQVAHAQVHPEPRQWNEILKAPQSSEDHSD